MVGRLEEHILFLSARERNSVAVTCPFPWPRALKMLCQGLTWTRTTLGLVIHNKISAIDCRHVWHQALSASKGLAVAFGSGEGVSWWSSMIPKTCSRMMSPLSRAFSGPAATLTIDTTNLTDCASGRRFGRRDDSN